MAPPPSGRPPQISLVPSCEQLNVQLIRVLLRPLGSSAFIKEEVKLVELVTSVLRDLIKKTQDLPKMTSDEVQCLALDICTDLLVRWRLGELYMFSLRFLRKSIFIAIAKDWPRRGRAPLEDLPDPDTPTPLQEFIGKEDQKRLRQFLEKKRQRDLAAAQRVRAKLKPEDQALFDAWVRHQGQRGWQSAYAKKHERSPTWVNNHLNHIRKVLRSDPDVNDPDRFVTRLHLYQEQDSLPEPVGSPAPQDAEEELSSEEKAEVPLSFEELTQALRQAFPDDQHVDCVIIMFAAGYADEDILAGCFGVRPWDSPDQRQRAQKELNDLLKKLHSAYVIIMEQFWRLHENGGER